MKRRRRENSKPEDEQMFAFNMVRRLKKDKKGQLYILAALIIGVVVFWAISPSNTFIAKPVNPDFQDISRNYDEEMSKLVNDLLEGGVSREELSLRLAEVSEEFVYQYAKKRDPEFGVVFILTNGDVVDIVNYLDESAEVNGEKVAGSEETCVVGSINLGIYQLDTGLTNAECEKLFDEKDSFYEEFVKPTSARLKNIKGGDEIVVEIKDAKHRFVVIGDSVQLNSIARREEDGQVQVYVSD